VVCPINASICTGLNRLPCSSPADQSMCGNCININYTDPTATFSGPGTTPCVLRNGTGPTTDLAQALTLTIKTTCQSLQSDKAAFFQALATDLSNSVTPPLSLSRIVVIGNNVTCPPFRGTVLVLPSANQSEMTASAFYSLLSFQITHAGTPAIGSPLSEGALTSNLTTISAFQLLYQYCPNHQWVPSGSCPVAATGSDNSGLRYGLGLGIGFGIPVMLIIVYLINRAFHQPSSYAAPTSQPEVVGLQDVTVRGDAIQPGSPSTNTETPPALTGE